MIPTVNIPDGVYPATIADYGVKESKAGKLYIYMDLLVPMGKAVQNVRWFASPSLVPAGKQNKVPREWAMKTFTSICPNFLWKDLMDKAKENLDIRDLIGLSVSVTIANELNPVTNAPRLSVKYVNPAQNKFKALSSNALSELGEDDGLPF